MQYMIDPPSGWKYGFPKPLPDDAWLEVNGEFGLADDFKVIDWLIENGYPRHEVELCGDHFYCRSWPENA